MPTPVNGCGLLDVTACCLTGPFDISDYVVCHLEKQALISEGTLLEIGVPEAAHKYVPQHNIQGQHDGIGVQQCGRVRSFEVTVCSHLKVHRCVGSN